MIEADNDAIRNGANYDMQYAWIMRTEVVDENGVVGRKIVEVIGFYDGQKVTAVFEGYTFPPSR